jgi:para-aminobenzoate synthetase component 1
MNYCVYLPYLSNAGQYCGALNALPWAVWLDSGNRARYDILTAQPVATLVTQGKQSTVWSAKGVQVSLENPFQLLRRLLGEVDDQQAGVPFAGGAIGYWGYDLSRWGQITESSAATDLPDMVVGIYDWALIIDHEEKTARLVSMLRHPHTLQQLPEILACLQSSASVAQSSFAVRGAITSTFTYAKYAAAFDRVIHYLKAGDCYQVNLAQRFSAAATGDGFSGYLYLREICPAPFAAWLNFPDVQIMSASPERFLRVQNNLVETKPIKGTRVRGKTAVLDAELVADLQSNVKDRAENLMIVDLLRNDLGRCCVAGSVAVPSLFKVESYANVHHLVSTVTGQLANGMDALQLLAACFPGGSITGAPKKRAMEIIDELEPSRRGVYCGAIGYIGFDGNMDSNIAIRSLVYADGEIQGWAGGGIVADSQCAAEYQETLDKASAILKLLRHFGGERAE